MLHRTLQLDVPTTQIANAKLNEWYKLHYRCYKLRAKVPLQHAFPRLTRNNDNTLGLEMTLLQIKQGLPSETGRSAI